VDNAADDVIDEGIILLSCYCVSLDYNFVPVGGFSACRNHVAPGIQSVCLCPHSTHLFTIRHAPAKKTKPLTSFIHTEIENIC